MRLGSPRARQIPLLCGMLLVAVNMRTALAVVGPVLGEIRSATHLTGAGLALLTALPVICFGALAPLAPGLARRWGLERALALALLLLTAGMAIRLGPGVLTLLGGTFVLGGGIALINVLLPALVKRDFNDRAGLVTGMYTTALNLSAAVAAGSAVPLSASLAGGWRGAFAIWLAPAFVAFAVWVGFARRSGESPATPRPRQTGGILRSRRARQLVIFTAAQSVIYYGVLSWLPSIFQAHGESATSAGLLLSVTTLVSAPVALVVPALAGRRPDQRGYVTLVAVSVLAGLLGLLVAPAAAPQAWAILIGVGLGGAFPLALTMFVLRAGDAAETARLSTVAQSIAYLVAAGGPLAMGLLRDQTGSWRPAIALLLVLAVVEFLAGLGAGRPGLVVSTHPPADPADPAGPLADPARRQPETG